MPNIYVKDHSVIARTHTHIGRMALAGPLTRSVATSHARLA